MDTGTVTMTVQDLAWQAESDAARLLKELVVDDVAAAIPVDPVKIARSLGIEVYISPLDSDVSGVLTKRAGEDAVIYLSASDSRNRRRFTCAHELGHFQQRIASQEVQFAFTDLREGMYAKGSSDDEIYANSFAAALLMPADEVRRMVAEDSGIPNPVVLALKFGVSAEAMSWRLKNLTLL